MTNIIETQLKSLISTYNKFSVWGKMLFFASLLIISMFLLSGFNKMREGFEQSDKFLLKSGNDVYDEFYVDIYDYLVFSNLKDDYEVGEIVNKTVPTSESKILDVGSGTGHHVAGLAAKGLDVLGIDLSPSMVKKAKEDFPKYKFEVGDATNSGEFGPNSFTHITCMYFTIYYIQDKTQFFQNAMKWLRPGGYLILHLVDRDQFDPILPPGNPLLYVSPQRYAEKRITSTKVKFDDFRYSADFKLNSDTNIATFEEKFKNDTDGKVRKNEHIMYMPTLNSIVNEVQQQGFILDSKVDLINVQYEYQYLYFFVKPE
uniref:Methyltransferase type 11 domain-containing protein n=1 Tax=viral metagenome TaxID=1070528 RepID=A0A6C0I6F9_9ZZZZ